MDSGERWRLGHRPGLDGLRGVAIGLVLVCHLTQKWWPAAIGAVGVTLFFTLSGFLITSLLLEQGDRGRLSLAAFYGRRARRLFPALAMLVAVTGSLTIVTGIGSVAAVGWVLVYGANWFSAASGATGLLGHTWSLAIEEQFYLVWPLVLIAMRRWRHGPLIAACAGVVVSVTLRFVLWDSGAGVMRVSFGSDTRADSLLVGCAVAILLHSGVRLRVSGRVAVLAAAALVPLVALSATPWVGVLVIETVVPWVAGVVLLHALSSPAWATGPVLRWLGQRSYGIYLWNWPILLSVSTIAGASPLVLVAATLAGLGVAELSWRYVERPFLSDRTGPAVAPQTAAAVAA
jgi:peptidoglycan/LPS O-acetylase OafA/YrhL